ncbi:multicopper oxidase domain-containing protein [Fictibacillus nanhaiensis]|uniref:multicopper oxidase family protein n=1 Tax=Fictibacillus nanhaiensis TaxID=742169 RepID=UPI00203CF26E|nr:multicopper oxidase domain-containing protein [Fictibacillus nanhaiensis]MCM3733193.1 multicopper oxidase domain-containing protein [Fictibacillus nanhaiensis]
MELEKFVDALPIPSIITPKEIYKGKPLYHVRMIETLHKFHRDLPNTKVWGYNGLVPGPTFNVERNKPIYVRWTNHLPTKHFLPVDQTIHGAHHNPEVRTVVHLHGSPSEPASDGHPEAWFTRNFQQTGPHFIKEIYHYTNRERAAALWYHDHALGITRLNVYAGLSGLYFVRDKHERSLPLPKGKYEIPLVVQDKSFNPDGSLLYPDQPENPSPDLPYPSIVPSFLGDTITVNGKVWPYIKVEPRKYRFRLLNASNTRTYKFQLSDLRSFYLIGTDGGLLERPIQVESLDVSPAERIDIVVDFSELMGQKIKLQDGFELGNPTGDIMEFQVSKPLSYPDHSRIPSHLSYFEPIPLNKVRKVRRITLNDSQDEYGRLMLLFDDKEWMDPPTETPLLNSVEIWELVNQTPGIHPIHVHLVNFRVLDRFDQNGNLLPPLPADFGLKDTVLIAGGETVRIIMKFQPYCGDYVWHCHRLEHEDHDMMRPLIIIPSHHSKPSNSNGHH